MDYNIERWDGSRDPFADDGILPDPDSNTDFDHGDINKRFRPIIVLFKA